MKEGSCGPEGPGQPTALHPPPGVCCGSQGPVRPGLPAEAGGGGGGGVVCFYESVEVVEMFIGTGIWYIWP